MSINSNALTEAVLFITKDYSRSTDTKISQLNEPKSAKKPLAAGIAIKCLTPALNESLE